MSENDPLFSGELSHICYKKIKHVFENRDMYTACSLRDKRISKKDWKTIWQREISLLTYWASQRILRSSHRVRSKIHPLHDEERPRVLSLLPQQGVTLHILRRALPFALLGYKVEVGFHASNHQQGAECVGLIADIFGVHHTLCCSSKTSEDKLSSGEYSYVHMTGSRRTLTKLKKVTRSNIIAATGRCSLLIGSDTALLRNLYNKLSRLNFPKSCTRLMAVAFVDNNKAILLTSRRRVELESFVRRMHPTLIYSAGMECHAIGGYRVFDVHSDGLIAHPIGFAADPIGGWPGDFRV